MLPKKTPEELEREKQQGYELPADLKDYAYNIFPSLQDIVPKRQQMFDDVEALQQPQAAQPVAAGAQTLEQSVEQLQPQQMTPPPAAPVVAQEEAPEQDEMEKAVDRAQEARDRAALFKQMASVRDAVIGVGLGNKFETDKSLYDEMSKEADRPLKNLLAKKEIKQAREKDDPNSQLSQLTRNSLAQLGLNMQGMDKVSYSQLEKLYPSLTQALYVKLKAESDKIQAQLSRENRAIEKAERSDAKKEILKDRKFNEINRRVQNTLKADEVKLYNNTKTTDALIDQAIRNWDSADKSYKEASQAAFMGYAKTAQQDASVVRESDMKVLSGGYNFGNLGSLLDKFAAKGQGSDFSKRELQEFKAVMKTIRDVKRNDLRQKLSPIMKTIESADIPVDMVLDPTFVGEIFQPQPEDRLKMLENRLKESENKVKANQARIEELRSRKGN